MSACGWLLTVQTPLKVSFWTGATSAWTFPLCTHSPYSFTFRFRALPEPQSAVTVWLSPAVPVYWAGRVWTSLNPMGSQVRNGGISPVSLNGGAETLWIPAAGSTLPCSSTQARASSRIAQAVKCLPSSLGAFQTTRAGKNCGQPSRDSNPPLDGGLSATVKAHSAKSVLIHPLAAS